MKFRFIPKPNLAWVLIPVLVLFRLLGVVDTWTAVGIFVVYVIVTFVMMYRNPKIRAEAERFGQQVEEVRLQEKKHELTGALRKSVRIQRRDAS